MPTPRHPLGPISGNITRKKQLVPYRRGRIAEAASRGDRNADIARAFQVADSTIRDTVRLDPLRDEGSSLPRKPRKKSYDDRDERAILRHARLEPKSTYEQLKEATGVKCSTTTIKKILKEHGIVNWRAKKRPELTKEHAKERYNWCKAREEWTFVDWKNIMWSDECSAERGSGKSTQWVFRTAAQKWNKEMISTYPKSRDISVMVWGCFWGTIDGIGRSELYILDRDFESKKHGYSSRSYIEVLEDQMPKCFQPGLVFMQDGASIHTSHAVRKWFADMDIPVLPWPAVSPDLNPIEHIWWHMKKQVLDAHPELQNMGKSEEALAALEQALIEAWNNLPNELFMSLLESMPRRIKACIEADGWHTKY